MHSAADEMHHIAPVKRAGRTAYKVRLYRQGRRVTVGTFPTVEEAICARDAFMGEGEAHQEPVERDGYRVEPAPRPVRREEIVSRARRVWDRQILKMGDRSRRRFSFDDEVVAIAFLGDQHLGAPGTNVPRVFDEAEIVRSTPGMYAGLMGDTINNMVVGKLRALRALDHELTLADEWLLFLAYVETIAPDTLFYVSGNHDLWTYALAGVDFQQPAVEAQGILYERHDLEADVVVGGHTFRLRCRHKWAGRSMYNATHGIERAAKFDGPFDVGVGAHTHVSGLVREFTVDGRKALAVQIGAYKRVDSYARMLGVPRPNDNVGCAVIFDGRAGEVYGFSDLEAAAVMLSALRGRSSNQTRAA